MKVLVRLAKFLGVGLGIGLALLTAIFAVKFYVLSPRSRPAPALTAPRDPEAVARGRYLVENVMACTGCHSPVQEDASGAPPLAGRLGAGRDFGEGAKGSAVHLRAPNLTADPATGLGAWSDGEIARAVREGVSRDGATLFPEMPYLTYAEALGDAEVLDVVAYLRTLAPIANDPGRTTVKFPVSMFVRSAPRPLASAPPAAPAATDPLARGAWLLRVARCRDCHDAVDGRMQKIPGKGFGGGFRFDLGARGVVVASNISSDPATGVGAWTDEELLRAIEQGKGKDGRTLRAMPWTAFQGLTAEDKAALVAALRKVPPVVNAVTP